MNEPELIPQSEVNNLLLHQKTELKLQELDKSIGRLGDTLVDMKDHQSRYHSRLTDFKKTVMEDISEDFVTKNEFRTFTAHMDAQWSKFYWTLSGAVTVVLFGGWLLNQYVAVDRLMHKQPSAQVLKQDASGRQNLEESLGIVVSKAMHDFVASEDK